ncbi:hypothetical protein NPIL_100521, partial [Nephila pilipes]
MRNPQKDEESSHSLPTNP